MSASMVPVRAPVKRQYAEYYILLSLISFAASVTLTRLFLELTGYPQIGNSELHIAHVLWGGLLLFIASLVPLIFANRWAYSLGAFLSRPNTHGSKGSSRRSSGDPRIRT